MIDLSALAWFYVGAIGAFVVLICLMAWIVERWSS